MKKLLINALLLIFAVSSYAQGDTIVINAHENTHLNWYGKWDNWLKFPDGSTDYHKVLMDITLGCPDGGCSEWDYTVKFELLINTHELDSTLILAPNFTVNNLVIDTFYFNLEPTFTNIFNEQTSSTISVKNDSLLLKLFNDVDEPFSQTDSLFAWPANYYNYEYSNSAEVIDSVLVEADSTWIVNYTNTYDVYEVIEPYEMGRLMTPYAGNYSKSWKHTYTFDVTDFVPLLQDSAGVRVFYGGWQDGFTTSVDFKFIEGTPPRKVLSIDNIYSSGMGGFKYGNPEISIEEYLTKKKFKVINESRFAKVRYTASGHSFGGAENCAEFCPKNYYLFIDDILASTQLIWKTCGSNALYPQAGTWLYDRAGWCPGDRTDTYSHDISNYISNEDSIVINVDMESYTYDFNAGFHPIYIVESQLVQYGEMNFISEASIEEIVAPNNDPRYSRNNPFGTRPLINIKNNGSEPLTSLSFEYYIDNGELFEFHWQGNIGVLETAIIELPSIVYPLNNESQADTHSFFVTILNPNETDDEWIHNNSSSSNFNSPSLYNEFFFLEIWTNKRPEENSLEIRNAKGEVIFEKKDLEASTRYRDTLELEDGFYELMLFDEGGDGLGFWANSVAGSGSIGFYKAQNDAIEKLVSDFGNFLHHSFYVENPVGINTTQGQNHFNIYPNPAKNTLCIQSQIAFSDEAFVSIYDLSGKELLRQEINLNEENIDLYDISNGIYIITITDLKIRYTEKLIVE